MGIHYAFAGSLRWTLASKNPNCFHKNLHLLIIPNIAINVCLVILFSLSIQFDTADMQKGICTEKLLSFLKEDSYASISCPSLFLDSPFYLFSHTSTI